MRKVRDRFPAGDRLGSRLAPWRAGLAATVVVVLAAPAAGAATLQGDDPPATTVPTTQAVDPAATAPPGMDAPETTTDVDVEAPVIDSGEELTDSERATRLLRWVTMALVGLAAAIVVVSIVFWRRTNPGRLMAKEASQVGTAVRVSPPPSGRSDRPGWSTEPSLAGVATRTPTVAAPVLPAGATVGGRVPAAAPAVAAVAQARGAGDPRLPSNGGGAPAPPTFRPTPPPHPVPSDPPSPLRRSVPKGDSVPSARPAAPTTLTSPAVSAASLAPAGAGRTPDHPHPHGLWASSGWDDPADVQPEPAPGSSTERPVAPAANPFDPR